MTQHVSENLYAVRSKDAERQQLERDMAAFLARGGEVVEVPINHNEGTRPAHKLMRVGFVAEVSPVITERQKDRKGYERRAAQERRAKKKAAMQKDADHE